MLIGSACSPNAKTLPSHFFDTRAVMSCVGVNIGALAVKVVRADAKNAIVMAHQGRPLELEELLAMPEFAAAEYFGVSGHRGQIG